MSLDFLSSAASSSFFFFKGSGTPRVLPSSPPRPSPDLALVGLHAPHPPRGPPLLPVPAPGAPALSHAAACGFRGPHRPGRLCRLHGGDGPPRGPDLGRDRQIGRAHV